jgi:hypothetical protein
MKSIETLQDSKSNTPTERDKLFSFELLANSLINK